jgi:hypothetical protein
MTKQQKPKLSPTQKVLAQMLVEDTGRRLTDSGDYYGRHYEANKGRDFLAEREGYYQIIGGVGDRSPSVIPAVSVFHWLDAHLVYAPPVQRLYARFARLAGNRDRSGLTLATEFPLWLREKGRYVTGLYGDEADAFEPTNTYNQQNALSQDVQFVYFEVEEDGEGVPYVLLSIHNGCDATSGYTAPKAFSVTGNHASEGAAIYGYTDVELVGYRPEDDPDQGKLFEGGERFDRVTWRSEDGGGTWHLDEGRDHFTWEQYGNRTLFNSCGSRVAYETTTDPALRGLGFVYVDVAARKVYCPLTGWEIVPYF